MEKLIIQRYVNVWIEDVYEVEEINDENIDNAIQYNLDSVASEVLWDTVEDLNYEVFDKDYKLIKRGEN